MMKVFLGGTCNGSHWRDKLLTMLRRDIDCYNPVVDYWTPECRENEKKAREESDYTLYVLSPEMTGVYSIAEATADVFLKNGNTIFVLLFEAVTPPNNSNTTLIMKPILKFNEKLYSSLHQTAKFIENLGGTVFYSLEDVAEFLNTKAGEMNGFNG